MYGEGKLAIQDLAIINERVRSPNIIIALCGLLILFDGYDLIVYGAVAPALLGKASWGLTPGMVGRAASITLFGMLLGALVAGTLADRIGRRKVIIGSLLSFSVMMIGSGLAPNFLVFEGTRFLAGLGLGALFPTVTALIIEFSPPKRKAMAYSIALLGYLAGGIISGMLGMLLIQEYGWRPLMIIGGAPILLLSFFIRLIPESPEWLATKNRQTEANQIANQYGLPNAVARPAALRQVGIRSLFSEGRLLPTLNAWSIHFCSLLLTFGMVNWLPTIMNKMGYDLGSALLFSVTLNLGAAVGLLIGARIADRGNVKIVVAGMFLLGACSIWLLTQMDQGLQVYGLVALAGTGTIGTQILANILVGNLYPVEIRGTGLGFSLGIGRIGGMIGPAIGGAVLGAGLAPQWNFYIFASVGALGCVLALMTLLYRKKAD
ncbi:aromatic acid/H+ symport family MFS transporter (plasmid) [Rhizobium sp. WSM4643]|uniref:MFS transporter n=1 Tax=Rhizobium sp. WSM4643 TaxID=3138253 RepID=UPI0021A7226E|nr:aromatic acid/H+ symport family MFS transporter [Rhizobium leguminosarum]UWM78140.1 aromatic acid/H+ symport family MFS transporter [Rhizobium leguminosarum bv. viciae]